MLCQWMTNYRQLLFYMAQNVVGCIIVRTFWIHCLSHWFLLTTGKKKPIEFLLVLVKAPCECTAGIIEHGLR